MMQLQNGEILDLHSRRLDVDGRLLVLAALLELFLPVLRTCCPSNDVDQRHLSAENVLPSSPSWAHFECCPRHALNAPAKMIISANFMLSVINVSSKLIMEAINSIILVISLSKIRLTNLKK